MMLRILGQLEQMCSDPATAGLIAIGAIKDDVPREPMHIVEDLEGLLAETRSLPLRNAIHLSLKDLCKQAGKNERALRHLREMLAENDKAMQSPKVQPPRRRRAPAAPKDRARPSKPDAPRRGKAAPPPEKK